MTIIYRTVTVFVMYIPGHFKLLFRFPCKTCEILVPNKKY